MSSARPGSGSLARIAATRCLGLRKATGDLAAGKAKAADCAHCHGDDGKGGGKTPDIAGLSSDKLLKAMQEYQNGTRTKSPKMTEEAKGLSAKDIANLAAYYATLKEVRRNCLIAGSPADRLGFFDLWDGFLPAILWMTSTGRPGGADLRQPLVVRQPQKGRLLDAALRADVGVRPHACEPDSQEQRIPDPGADQS